MTSSLRAGRIIYITFSLRPARRLYDVTLIYAAYAKRKIQMACANLCCLCQTQNTNGLCCSCQNSKYSKQLLNSVLVGYEELLRPRFMLSAEAEG